MSAISKEEMGGLHLLGAVELKDAVLSRPITEYTYITSGLGLLGVEELQAKKQQALEGLELLGTGRQVDMPSLKRIFAGFALGACALLEITSSPEDRRIELAYKWLRRLIDLFDERK